MDDKKTNHTIRCPHCSFVWHNKGPHSIFDSAESVRAHIAKEHPESKVPPQHG